jgi:subfamily B ATP-binding cassette protein MsbA
MWMLYLSWELSAVFLIVVPFAMLIFKVSSRRFRAISSRIQESVGDITHIAKEALQGQRVVKIFDGYRREEANFHRANNRNRQQAMKRAAILSATVPLTVFLGGFGVAGVIWLAFRLEISPGVFSSYLVSMTMMMRPLKNLSKVNEVVQTGLAGAQSIFHIMDMEREVDQGTEVLGELRGDVSFDKVCFKYSEGGSVVLDDVSFDLSAGTTVALVGASGSGKSTVTSLLLRFYSPSSGEIRIDDHPLASVTLKSLRENTAIVTQEIVLFDDTIRNNIAYGEKGEIDEDRLEEAARAANVLEFVDTMPAGLDTMVGEMGVRLSGGQRQRIAIARALYRDAPILILDEATSSLDSGSEQHIQSAISHLIQNRTTLVIAHRLSTIESADLILVLDDGRIVERGTHDELLSRDGVYAHLHRTQNRQQADDAG